MEDADPNCSNQTMSAERRHLILEVQGAIAAFSLAVCVVAMLLVCLCKVWWRFTHRISIYLLLSASLTEVVFCLQLVMFHYDSSNMTHVYVCKALGFLLQYSLCSMLLFMSVLAFHLACVAILIEIRPCILIGVTYRVLISALSEPTETTRNVTRRRALFLEAFYVLIPTLVPFVFAWIPFVHDAYGLAGPFCWIKDKEHECDYSDQLYMYAGHVEIYALWYGPLFVLCCVDSALIAAILIILCKRACSAQQTPDPAYKKTLKENIPLLAYPILYQFLALISIGQRIHRTVELQTHDHVLWMAYTLIPPLQGLLVAIVYMIYLAIWKLSNRSLSVSRSSTPLLRSK